MALAVSAACANLFVFSPRHAACCLSDITIASRAVTLGAWDAVNLQQS